MVNYIRVSTQSLDKDRETIQSEMEGIAKSVENLYQEMRSLGAAWEGAAWQNFQGQVADDIENMRLICRKMSGFLSHMEYAGTEYRKCAEQVGHMIDGIRI